MKENVDNDWWSRRLNFVWEAFNKTDAVKTEYFKVEFTPFSQKTCLSEPIQLLYKWTEYEYKSWWLVNLCFFTILKRFTYRLSWQSGRNKISALALGPKIWFIATLTVSSNLNW